MNKTLLKQAHQHSYNNKAELEKSKKCGCFYCLSIFNPREIKEWIFANNSIDKRGTAICPFCGVDSVIGESSGFPITERFLKRMQKRWF